MVASTTNGDVKVCAVAGRRRQGDGLQLVQRRHRRHPAGGGQGQRAGWRSDQGDIYSDFDVALDKTPPQVKEERSGGRYRIEIQQELRGTIGGGGPEMHFKTFNGSIYLRKR